MANEAKQSMSIALDQAVGFRAWGLILYGALPANLTVFTTLQKNIVTIDNLLYFLLAVSLLPLILTFLLIRSREREWYLTSDLLFIRSALTTLLIVIYASLISGLSGIIHGKYVLSTIGLLDSGHKTALAESYLLGIGSLVISSTLLIAIVTKNSELPGLPSPKFVESLSKIREKIRQLQASDIWRTYIPLEDNELKDKVEELKLELEQISLYTGNKLAKKSLEPVNIGVTYLVEVIELIQESGNEEAKQINWRIYFAPEPDLTNQQKDERAATLDMYLAIWNLKKLKLGG